MFCCCAKFLWFDSNTLLKTNYNFYYCFSNMVNSRIQRVFPIVEPCIFPLSPSSCLAHFRHQWSSNWLVYLSLARLSTFVADLKRWGGYAIATMYTYRPNIIVSWNVSKIVEKYFNAEAPFLASDCSKIIFSLNSYLMHHHCSYLVGIFSLIIWLLYQTAIWFWILGKC